MGLSNLPSEVRNRIYTYWFSERNFKPARPLYTPYFRLPGDIWLSDTFTICKSISYDPWLTQAILRNSTFHVENVKDLSRLQERFGAAGLQEIIHISLGSAMTTDAEILHIRSAMPKLSHVRLTGSVAPLWRVWDCCLDDFDKHAWSRFIACLCIFAPGRVPGPTALLTDLIFDGKVELVVNFVFHDPEFGERRMQFSTVDWMVTYQLRGKSFKVPQVRPEELQAVLDKSEGDLW